MTLANTTSKIRVYINGEDYSNFLIEGSISDDSAYSTNIITSTGSIVLGGDTTILDYNKTLFPLGSRVNIYATLDNGKAAKLPRGQLYVLGSSIDINSRQTTLELGCTLAYLSSRESSYTSEVKTLIQSFISSSVLDSFIIDDYNLSTLQTLLEINGKVIFQDPYGHIQSLSQFGNDGLGSDLKKAKLTSFDNETAVAIDSIGGAIEDLPSAVIVTADVEIPSSADADVEEEEETDSPNPPPFITSQLLRLTTVPDARKGGFNGFFTIRNEPSLGEAATELVAGCGTITQPLPEAPSRYGYTAIASCSKTENTAKETVTQGRYINYGGPGNQVDFEYDFEYCSAATYASGTINNIMDRYVDGVNVEIEKSNALLSKANQAYALRDDYASREVTPIYTYGFGGRLDDTLRYSEEDQETMAAIEYYGCAADQYFEAAEDILEGAELIAKEATSFADSFTGIYGYSRMQQVFYFYGDGDQVIEKVQFNYIHKATTNSIQKIASSIPVNFRNSSSLVQIKFKVANGLDFSDFYNPEGLIDKIPRFIPSFYFVARHDDPIAGNPLETSDNIKFRTPESSFNLVLASKTVTRYKYGSIYNTERESFFDFQDPSNSYSRVNYSSASGPEEPDRIEYQRDGNGCLVLNDDSSNTENKELVYKANISIRNKIGTASVPVSWLGRPGRQPKEVQLPLSFAPISKKICNGTKFVPDVAKKLNGYNGILSRYARNLAKKITADNLGYRITEKGTRAEIFEYYPFYPISLNISSLGKKYKLRAASSNWVFDSDNILCSFDCFNVGEIEGLDPTVEVTPSNYVGFARTESTVVVNTAYFNLPATASSIQITSLPSNGTLNLNGSAVSVGDTITITQINAGNVSFTP